MERRNTGGKNENAAARSTQIPLRTWRENAETIPETQVPFFPLDFGHLGGGSSGGAREQPAPLNAHMHLGACKALTAFEKIWFTVAGEEWGGGENFNFLHQMASFRKSPFSPTLSHTKNEKAATRSSHREKNRWAASLTRYRGAGNQV